MYSLYIKNIFVIFVIVRYYVHMNKSFVSITEFRGSTKVFLDAAKVDAVTVRRGDDLFTVEYAGSVFDAVEKFALDKFNEFLPDMQEALIKKNNSGASPVQPRESTYNFEGWKSAGERKGLDKVLGDTYPCCLNKTVKCKHWDWDGLTQTYTNRNTGEVMEAGVE